jgi:hypothetical protein
LGWQRTDESSPNGGQASVQHPDTRANATEPQAIDDFTKFKAWVDNDPFTAVFGRRLARLQNPTVPSWSPFSWILHPKIAHESAAFNTPVPSRVNDNLSSILGTNTRAADVPLNTSDNRSTSTIEPSRRAANTAEREDEYEFDPISMRKVLKSTPVVEATPKPSKPLFGPLFAEQGVNIPVKSYKPHRVFGHGAGSSTGKFKKEEGPSDSSALKSKAETSRLAELRRLKAATLGNSIDTTAEYHGKWVSADEKATEEAMKKTAADPHADEAPLFSGTTYEGKSRGMVMQTKSPKQDWLSREGFGSKDGSAVATHNTKSSNTDLPFGKSVSRLQPSLDRLNVPSGASGRLEPSIDRAKASSEKPTPAQSFKKSTGIPDEAQESVSEDLDLLRASDIRASTRPSRWTKQDSRKTKQNQREKLEEGFRSQQKDDDGLSIVFPKAILESSKKLSESLNSLWHRVRAQQGSWLAQGKSIESGNHEAHEARTSQVKPPTNVRRASTRPIQTFTPSKEVLDAEQQNTDRTLALRKATLEATRIEAETKAKEKDLARTIKATYEEEYGPITVNHRQAKGLERIDQLAETIKEAKIRADRNAIKNMIVQCEHALREAKVLRVEIVQKIKAIEARSLSSEACSMPLSTKPTTKENVVTENSTETPGVASEQPLSASTEPFPSSTPMLYKVLAYDSSTLQMNIAETTSSMPAAGDSESQLLHPTEVLSRLNNVAKFLPYFTDMEKQGYEIVSGSGDVLVFKKVRAAPSPNPPPTATEPRNSTTETLAKPFPAPSNEQTANEKLQDSSPAPPPTNSPKVRRQEPVFSGSGQTWHQEEAGSSSSSSNGHNKNTGTERGWFRRTIKPVVLTATVGAATAYAVGVVAERGGEPGPRQPGRPVRMGRPGIFSTEDSR